jgi:hypothetical protein
MQDLFGAVNGRPGLCPLRVQFRDGGVDLNWGLRAARVSGGGEAEELLVLPDPVDSPAARRLVAADSVRLESCLPRVGVTVRNRFHAGRPPVRLLVVRVSHTIYYAAA